MTLNSLFFIQGRARVSCYKHSASCTFLHPCSEGWSQVWRTPTSSPLHERDFLVENSIAQIYQNLGCNITTVQRGQTIHKMDVSYIQEMDGRYRITICGTLKQTKPGRHLEPIDLFAYPNDNKTLCG